MNDTKTYLCTLREELAHRLAGRFLAYLTLFALVCAASFAWVWVTEWGGAFLAVRPAGMVPYVRALTSTAVILCAVLLSAHTMLSGAVGTAAVLWRGVCLGCAGGLMKSGAVVSIAPTWVLALTLYFAASVGVMLAASVAHVYSLGLCRTYADETRKMRRGLAGEFLRLWLILSGMVFILGGAAVALV